MLTNVDPYMQRTTSVAPLTASRRLTRVREVLKSGEVGAGEWVRTIDLLITNHHRACSPASASVLLVGNVRDSFH